MHMRLIQSEESCAVKPDLIGKDRTQWQPLSTYHATRTLAAVAHPELHPLLNIICYKTNHRKQIRLHLSAFSLVKQSSEIQENAQQLKPIPFLATQSGMWHWRNLTSSLGWSLQNDFKTKWPSRGQFTEYILRMFMFNKTLWRRRFKKIMRFLCIDVKRERSCFHDNFSAPSTLWNSLIENYQQVYVLGPYITTDAQLLPYKAKYRFIKYAYVK